MNNLVCHLTKIKVCVKIGIEYKNMSKTIQNILYRLTKMTDYVIREMCKSI